MLSMHRVGYAVVKTLLAIAVLALPRAPLKHPEPGIMVVAIGVVLSSLAYVRLQGSDPGFLTEDLLRVAHERTNDEDSNLVMTEEEDDDDVRDDELSKHQSSSQAEKAYRVRRIQQITTALQQREDDDEDDAFDREIDEMQHALEQQPLNRDHESDAGQVVDAFCVECSLFPPLRSHHCRVCGHCVATFDHHCHLVGTCIGERNHGRFWWFLLLQTVELVLGVLVVTARFQPPAPKGSWSQANGWPLFLLIVLTLLLLFVGSMLAFHTFLAVTSMTTYELGRGTDRIAYLRDFRECDLPFSRGLVSNVAFFCWPRPHRRKSRIGSADDLKRQWRWLPRLWQPPAPITDRDSDKICDHLWENKYYSCC